jgi:4-amino-4-deoxy-L-arabinose transferase-like glycosyltransferase
MRRALGWMGLVVALAAGTVVRWTLPGDVEDLRPRPDALEYEEGARNLVAGEGYALVMDGGRYPPRYPPGFSLLIVPAMWLGDGRHGTGIWTVLASALVGIACVWAMGRLVGGPASALVAGLLLALAPLHVRWSRAVMSDVPTASAAAALALAGLLCRRRDAGAWFVLGVGAGLAALLRSTCTLLAVPLAAMLLVEHGVGWPAVRRVIALGAGVAVGLLPLGLYDFLRFGSPLASGYEYWVAAEFFRWAHVLGRPAAGGNESNLIFYGRLLAGGGSLYGWPVALLAATGIVLGIRRPGAARALTVVTIGTGLMLLAIYLPFFWQWDRFFLLLLPLVTALAAVPAGADRPAWLRIAAAALVALALTLDVSRPGAFARPDRPNGETANLRAIAATVAPNAVLIARGDVLLVSRLFHDATDRLWVPVGRCEHRALIRDHHLKPYAPANTPQSWVWDVIGPTFDAGAVEAAVHALLASGRPVYFSPALSYETPLSVPVSSLLRAHFLLEPVATPTPTGLVRVRERS